LSCNNQSKAKIHPDWWRILLIEYREGKHQSFTQRKILRFTHPNSGSWGTPARALRMTRGWECETDPKYK